VDRSSKPGSKQKSRRKAAAPASTRLPKQVDATQDRELTVAQAERVHEASSASLSIAEEEDDIPASAPARPASKPESQSKEKRSRRGGQQTGKGSRSTKAKDTRQNGYISSK